MRSQHQMEKKWQVFSERLIARRNHLGLTQGELASKINASLRSVTNWESGKFGPRGEAMRKLATALATSVAYLVGEEERQYPPSNVSPIAMNGAPATRKVPVVSWASAGAGGNFSDLAEMIDEYIESSTRDERAYALIIEGDSMLPKFEPGDRIVFEPNRLAQNGDVVVARLEESGQVYFKLFHQLGPRGEIARLTSFNPTYPPLEFPLTAFRFIHPMLELKRKWKR
jgi:SOS-response transcriptional repressor LexA